MKRFIGKTKNNIEVYEIVNNKHMEAHASISKEVIAEAIIKVEYTSTFWMDSIQMDKIIGKDSCVITTEEDEIVYVCREGRERPSKMVLNRVPENTTYLTIGMCTDEDGLVTIFTAFAGIKAPKELNDPRMTEEERPEAEAFWANHALCM